MKRKISALEARRKLGELLESVYYRGDEVVIERAGKVMAVIVPAERYEAIERSRNRILQLVEKNWERNKDVPYETIGQDVGKAIAELRSRRKRGR
jgi:prevent-host-death family protein